MPISLPPFSRRKFLGSSLAAAVGLALGDRLAWAAERSTDPNVIALLSDIHINANPAKLDFNINMTDHLKQAIAEVMADKSLPSGVLINGDCAHRMGRAEDYAQLTKLLDPARELGLPIHLALGNHDARDPFWTTFGKDADRSRQQDAVADRQVMLIETPYADWILLDSLEITDATAGSLGERQIAWLKATLDARKSNNKPVIVMVHHHPELPKPTDGKAPATQPVVFPGILDSPPLMEILFARRQVKALFFGHTHIWHEGEIDGLHFINLPAVAYVFDKEQPSAWTLCTMREGGATLRLNCLDPKHDLNGKEISLTWR